MDQSLITKIFGLPDDQAWQAIFEKLYETFSPSIRPDFADAITTERDKSIEKLDNTLAGSAWELWQQFEQNTLRTSQQLKQFWANRPGW